MDDTKAQAAVREIEKSALTKIKVLDPISQSEN